jgi:glycosyltransferase involved in cell wall biosynthesis
VIEAFCRGRAVVGSRAAGIPDLVEHERTGLLVEAEDVHGLADALVRVLGDRSLAERLGAAAAAEAPRWTSTPEEFAANVAALVREARARRTARRG